MFSQSSAYYKQPRKNIATRYTTWPTVSGHLLVEHLIPKSRALIWSWSALCCYNSFHSSGRFSTRCWNIAAGTCFHSATRALLKSGTDVGWLGLTCSQRSNWSQRCSMGLKPCLFAGQSFTSTAISDKQFLYGPRFVHGVIVMLKQEMAFPKLLPQSWKHRLI